MVLVHQFWSTMVKVENQLFMALAFFLGLCFVPGDIASFPVMALTPPNMAAASLSSCL